MYFAKDPGSHYYAGLSFCMVSTCFVFNWTFREILATLSLIVIIYLAATLPHMVHNKSHDVTHHVLVQPHLHYPRNGNGKG